MQNPSELPGRAAGICGMCYWIVGTPPLYPIMATVSSGMFRKGPAYSRLGLVFGRRCTRRGPELTSKSVCVSMRYNQISCVKLYARFERRQCARSRAFLCCAGKERKCRD